MYLSLVFLAAISMPLLGMIPLVRRRVSPYRVVVEGVIAGCVAAILIMILAKASGQGVYEEFQQAIKYTADYLAKDTSLTEAMNTGDKTEAERIDFFVKLYEEAAQLIPASIGIFAAIASYFEYILLSKIIKPKQNPALPMPKFRDFSLPRNAVIGWAVIYLLSWIVTAVGILPDDTMQSNANALFSFAFSLQGMSVIFMYCHRKHAPKAIGVIIILFFMTSALTKLLLLILGLVDLIFGLKARLR